MRYSSSMCTQRQLWSANQSGIDRNPLHLKICQQEKRSVGNRRYLVLKCSSKKTSGNTNSSNICKYSHSSDGKITVIVAMILKVKTCILVMAMES